MAEADELSAEKALRYDWVLCSRRLDQFQRAWSWLRCGEA